MQLYLILFSCFLITSIGMLLSHEHWEFRNLSSDSRPRQAMVSLSLGQGRMRCAGPSVGLGGVDGNWTHVAGPHFGLKSCAKTFLPLNGSRGWNWTTYPQGMNLVSYRCSTLPYGGDSGTRTHEPSECKSDVLPTELYPHLSRFLNLLLYYITYPRSFQ